MDIISKNWLLFVRCHHGLENILLHLVGFALIFFGLYADQVIYPVIGGLIQEGGHAIQYLKTKNQQDHPFTCITPQAIFFFGPYIAVILFILIF